MGESTCSPAEKKELADLRFWKQAHLEDRQYDRYYKRDLIQVKAEYVEYRQATGALIGTLAVLLVLALAFLIASLRGWHVRRRRKPPEGWTPLLPENVE